MTDGPHISLRPVPGLCLRRGGRSLRTSHWWARPLRVTAREWWPRILTAPLRALPDFVIIGAQRAGTTSLFQYLSDHPQVEPSLKKEVHFFDENWSKGRWWYRAHFPVRRRQEPGAGSLQLTGEGSPNYLFDADAPGRAAQLLPSTRFLVLLRNPVDRAFSQHQMNLRKGYDSLGFADAVDAEPQRLAQGAALSAHERMMLTRRASYLGRGIYADQVARWQATVGTDRILVLRSECFLADPGQTMDRVHAFLGLGLHRAGEYPRYHDSGGTRMDPATRRRLLSYFAPHNARLFELIGEAWDWGA